jgi:hypothetical protein
VLPPCRLFLGEAEEDLVGFGFCQSASVINPAMRSASDLKGNLGVM